MNNSIVIMAGGQGSRLKRKLKSIPKSLAPIGEKTILDYQIDHLNNYKNIDIHFCLGHGSTQILEHLKKTNLKFTYLIEKKPLGTYGALYESKKFLNDNFFVLFGDVITNFEIDFGFEEFKNSNSDFLIISRYTDHPEDSDLINFDKDKRVNKISRNKNYSDLTSPIGNTGLFYGKKSSIKEHKKTKEPDIFKHYLAQNLENFNVKTILSNSYIKDLGTEERLNKESKDLDLKLTPKSKIVFFDRDETIIDNNEKNITEDLKFKKNALSLIKKLQKENYSLFLITNQPGVAKGFCSLEDVENFHNYIQNYLISNKVKPFEHIKFCPHHPEKGHVGERKKFKINCKCRKPKNEMVEEILSEFNLNEKNLDLLFIGDTINDFELSQKYTSNFFLIKSNFSNIEEAKKLNLKIFNNLKEIQDYI